MFFSNSKLTQLKLKTQFGHTSGTNISLPLDSNYPNISLTVVFFEIAQIQVGGNFQLKNKFSYNFLVH